MFDNKRQVKHSTTYIECFFSKRKFSYIICLIILLSVTKAQSFLITYDELSSIPYVNITGDLIGFTEGANPMFSHPILSSIPQCGYQLNVELPSGHRLTFVTNNNIQFEPSTETISRLQMNHTFSDGTLWFLYITSSNTQNSNYPTPNIFPPVADNPLASELLSTDTNLSNSVVSLQQQIQELSRRIRYLEEPKSNSQHSGQVATAKETDVRRTNQIASGNHLIKSPEAQQLELNGYLDTQQKLFDEIKHLKELLSQEKALFETTNNDLKKQREIQKEQQLVLDKNAETEKKHQEKIKHLEEALSQQKSLYQEVSKNLKESQELQTTQQQNLDKHLVDTKKKHQNKIACLNDDVSQQKKLCAKISSKLTLALNEKVLIKKELDHSQNKLQEFQAQLTVMQNQVKESSTKSEALKHKTSKEISELTDQKNEIQKLYRLKESTLYKTEAEIVTLKKKETMKEELIKRHENEKQSLTSQVITGEQALALQKKEVEKLKKAFQETNQRATNLKKDLTKHQETNRKNQQLIKSLNEKTDKKQKRIIALEDEIRKKNEATKEQVLKAVKIDAEKSHLKALYEKKIRKYSALEERYHQSMSTCSTLTYENQKLKSEIEQHSHQPATADEPTASSAVSYKERGALPEDETNSLHQLFSDLNLTYVIPQLVKIGLLYALGESVHCPSDEANFIEVLHLSVQGKEKLAQFIISKKIELLDIQTSLAKPLYYIPENLQEWPVYPLLQIFSKIYESDIIIIQTALMFGKNAASEVYRAIKIHYQTQPEYLTEAELSPLILNSYDAFIIMGLQPSDPLKNVPAKFFPIYNKNPDSLEDKKKELIEEIQDNSWHSGFIEQNNNKNMTASIVETAL